MKILRSREESLRNSKLCFIAIAREQIPEGILIDFTHLGLKEYTLRYCVALTYNISFTMMENFPSRTTAYANILGTNENVFENQQIAFENEENVFHNEDHYGTNLDNEFYTDDMFVDEETESLNFEHIDLYEECTVIIPYKSQQDLTQFFLLFTSFC